MKKLPFLFLRERLALAYCYGQLLQAIHLTFNLSRQARVYIL